MKIFIDSDCKCHTSDDGTMRSFEVSFFDYKCPELIEGYRYVPRGETWTRSDGEVFQNGMITPCKDYSELEEYEWQTVENIRKALADADAALAELGVEWGEDNG